MCYLTRLSAAFLLAIAATAAVPKDTPAKAANGPVPAAPAMFKADPELTGVYGGPAPRSLRGVRFTFTTGGAIRATPTIYGDTLFVGSADGYFYALDAMTGALRWRLRTGIVDSTASAMDGTVFFAGRDHRLYAVSAADGKIRWTYDLGKDRGQSNYWDFYTSSPIPSGANVYVGSGNGYLDAIDRQDGHLVWRFNAGARIRSTPAVGAGHVVFGTQDGFVFALDAASGALLWKAETRGVKNTFALKNNDTTSILASPSIADGMAVIGSRDAYLYGFDLKSGRRKWSITHDGGSWILGTAVKAGTVYVGSGSAFFLQAADLRTGKEKWRFPTLSGNFASPAISGDVVLISDLSGTLYAVNALTGKDLWSFAMGDRAFSSPVVHNGIVYAASDAGTLYALDTSQQASTPHKIRKFVYYQGKKSDKDFTWFHEEVGAAILGYFRGAGYQQIGESDIARAVNDQLHGGERSVIVFADNVVPQSMIVSKNSTPLLRRYLEAGGRVVFLGINPLTLKLDPRTGELTDIDDKIPQAVLGVHLLERSRDYGYHLSDVTREGATWGLRGTVVTHDAIDPAEVDAVLARDEFGFATEWAKNFGTKGGVLLQLVVPTHVLRDLTPYRIAVEHGL